MKQMEIDWTNVLHKVENNRESQQHLEDNYFHFTGQCAVLYSLLLQGHSFTTSEGLIKYGIGDLRRRIKDLRDKGVNIQDEFMTDPQGKKTRYKRYFLKPQNN